MNNTKLKLCFMLALALAFSLPAISQMQSEEPHDTLWTIKTYPREVKCVRFSPDGKYVAVSLFSYKTEDHDAYKNPLLFETETGKLVRYFVAEPDFQGWSVLFSPDGKYLLSGNSDPMGTEPVSIQMWDVETGEKIKTLLKDYPEIKGNTGIVLCNYSDDGKNLLVLLEGGGYIEIDCLLIMDAETYEIKHEIKNLDGWTRALISPDGKIIAIANQEMPDKFYIKLISTDTYKNIGNLGPYENKINDIAFSQNSKLLATAGTEYLDTVSVKVWNLDTKQIEKTFYAGYEALSVKFYNDYLVTGSGDGKGYWSVNIWNYNNGKLIYKYLNNYIEYPYPDAPELLSISQNGKYISVAGSLGISLLNERWNGTTVKESNTIINNLSVSPNPTNNNIIINYNVVLSENIILDIIDTQGIKVEELINKYHDIGNYSIEWNTNNIPNGIYFCRLIQNGKTDTIKILINK